MTLCLLNNRQREGSNYELQHKAFALVLQASKICGRSVKKYRSRSVMKREKRQSCNRTFKC